MHSPDSHRELKVLGVSSLPEFVANSQRMVILWNDTYFERLWCNAEVATFSAINGCHRVDFLPLWLAPWILSTLAVHTFCEALYDHYGSQVLPMAFEYFTPMLSSYPITLSWLSTTIGLGLGKGLSYLPAGPFAYFYFSQKLTLQNKMKQQITTYRLENAKCAVESDRAIVSDLVTKLFNEVPDLGNHCKTGEQQDAVERFNYYMQNDIYQEIQSQVGSSTTLPYALCCLVNLHMFLESAAQILGCDGMACDTVWVVEGCQSIWHWLAIDISDWVYTMLLVVPANMPLILAGLAQVDHACGLIAAAISTEESLIYLLLTVNTRALLCWNRYLFMGRSGTPETGQATFNHNDAYIQVPAGPKDAETKQGV